MSTYESASSSDRAPRQRGGRRRGGRNNRERADERPQSRSPRSQSTPAAPAKPSFLEKVIGFFTGKKAAAPAPERPQYVPRSADKGSSVPREDRFPDERTERTEREPREPRAERPPRQVRKPEAVEVTSPKLYVGNLSFDATESDLSELFNGVGIVTAAEIVTHKETERSKGFGFVTLTTVDEAKRAVDVLHDKDFMGRKLVVAGAKTPIERE